MRFSAVLTTFLLLAACGDDLALAPPSPPKGPVGVTEPEAGDVAPALALEVVPASALPPDPERLGPPYPVVLVHGFSGWSEVGPLGYFFEVLDDLAARGEHEVYAPGLPPYNSSEQRAVALAHFIDQVLDETGRKKVHLIAHSQGGIDSRLLVSGMGYAPRVATLTTIATPHHGTPLADMAVAAPDGMVNPAGQMLAWLIGTLDSPPGDAAWDSDPVQSEAWTPNMAASSELMSSAGMAAFNEQNPDPEGLPIFSVAGYSNLLPAPSLCEDAVWSKPGRVDAQDPLLYGSGLMLSGADPLHPRANDGIVPTDSMVWGTFLGCVPADHFDQIGQVADLLPNIVSGFEHKSLYRRLFTHLRAVELALDD